ncbi:MAG: lipoprotein insertase outer membrane protein LolB [Stenotrophobium sp.]
MRLRFCLAAAALLLLAACASLPRGTPESSAIGASRSVALRAQLQRIDAFAVQGRIAGGALGIKGDVHWQQNADDSFSLRISGPFGMGASSISGTPQQVVVRSGDGKTQVTDPQVWLQQNLGWTLPIARLRYWVLGLPAADSPVEQSSYNADGTLASLQQDGWQLEYGEYLSVDGTPLPRKLQLSHADATFRVVIDGWSGLPGT